MKVCSNCKEQKPLSEFFKDKRAPQGVESWCKICRKISRKSVSNRITQRKWHLKAKYGLTLEQYESMLDLQGGKCSICGDDDPIILRGLYHFVIDHDHNCCPGQFTCGECLRGLLCHSCNLGIGNFKDDISIMKSAVRYLENFELRGGYRG